LAVALAWPTAALAQPPGDSRAALALAREGLSARRAGRDDEALAAFERSYALAPRVSVRAQMGFALQALGRWVDAERALDAVLSAEDPWVRRHRETVRAALDAVCAHLGWITLDVEPADVALRVEGEAVAAGVALRRPIGAVAVTATRDGYYTAERAVEVRGGETTREAIALRPRVDSPAPTASSAVPVAAPPPVSVAAPAVATELPARRASWSGPLALGAGGVAMLGLAAGLWLARDNALDALTASGCVETAADYACDARRADLARARARHDEAGTLGAAGVASLAVGAALLLAGGAWTVAEALAPRRAPLRPSRDIGALGLRWSF
jgi:hypothetical protein